MIKNVRSEQLAIVGGALERAAGDDIPDDNCGHPNLTVILSGDGFDGSACIKEILRNPTPEFRIIHQIPVFTVQMFVPTSGDVRSDHLFCHA